MEEPNPEFAAMCLAPAFDSTVPLPAFPRPGDVFAAPEAEEFPGGKGLNVARWLAARGRRAALGGLLGEGDAGAFAAEMERTGIADRMARVPGRVRRNELFAAPGGDFKVNRPSYPWLSAADAPGALALGRLAPDGAPPPRVAVLTGSMPKAVGKGFYAEAAKRFAALGAAVALDASGDALRLGLAARPAVVKPNRAEAEGVLGFSLAADGDVVRALRLLLDSAAAVVLSDGAAGCWFATRGDAGSGPFVRFMPSPRVDAVDPTGAGDTMLAEFLHRRHPAGAPDPDPGAPVSEDAMRWAVAAGAAAATTRGATPPDPALVQALFAAAGPSRPSRGA